MVKIVPLLFSMFTQTLDTTSILQSLSQASLINIEKKKKKKNKNKKKNKDPLSCRSYHPISLLNVDYKILARVLMLTEWDYLFRTLEKFVFGERFITWVKLLSTAPLASVRTNDSHSGYFPLFRGKTQGCPMSPMLFAIAIEPLAMAL